MGGSESQCGEDGGRWEGGARARSGGSLRRRRASSRRPCRPRVIILSTSASSAVHPSCVYSCRAVTSPSRPLVVRERTAQLGVGGSLPTQPIEVRKRPSGQRLRRQRRVAVEEEERAVLSPISSCPSISVVYSAKLALALETLALLEVMKSRQPMQPHETPIAAPIPSSRCE